VHTLEAAKACSQRRPRQPAAVEEAFDEEEPFDVEAEVETEETEGVAEEASAGDKAAKAKRTATGASGAGGVVPVLARPRRRPRTRGDRRRSLAPPETAEATVPTT